LKRISENNWWAIAFLLVALAWLSGLFIDVTGDSGLYAAISRQMVDSGDWFHLKINGEPYDQKPHMFFWLAGLGIQFFGNTNFAFKLFPFLYGVAGIYFTYRLGKQIFSDEAGKWAALIAGTSQIYFLYFFDYHTDIVLQTGVILALWQLAAYLQHQKRVNFVFGFLGVGLAMLAKGPVGAILPFFAVLFYLLAERDFKQLFHFKWLLGISVSMAVISPTLIHLYNSFGLEGLKFYFITNNFGRISGSYAGSSNDYFYYLYNAMWAFLPWTVFVGFGLFSEIKTWRNLNKENAWGIYLLGSVLLLLFILSIAKGKAPNYFLIAVSPIVVVAGNWLYRLNKMPVGGQRKLLISQMFFLVLISVFALFVVVVYSAGWLRVIIALMFLSVIIFSVVMTFTQNSLRKVVLGSLIVTGGLNLFLNAKIFPELYKYQGAKQAIHIFETQNNPETQLYNFEVEEYGIFFYAHEPVQNITNWDELYKIMSKPKSWIYTNEIKYNDIIKMNYDIDTVYQIRQRGMNRINLEFLNPKTREQSLKSNYLIITGSKKTE